MSAAMLLDINPEKACKTCVRVSAAVLALSAFFKLGSAGGNARILLEADPVFGITNQQVFLWVGLLELGVVMVLARGQSLPLKLILLATLSTDFLLYRAGLWWLDAGHPCPCLGNAAAWTHIGAKSLDAITGAALLWLVASSYGALLLLLSRRRWATRPGREAGAWDLCNTR